MILILNLKQKIEIKKIELLDATYRYNLNNIINQARFDQTTTPIGECSIEFIIKKLEP